MTRTRDIDTALRSLDPADRHVDPTSPQARLLRLRILRSDALAGQGVKRGYDPDHAANRPRRTTRAVRRIALAGGLVATVTAGVVVLPSMTGGDQAFATWTSTPSGATAQERAAMGSDCRRAQQEGAGSELADDLRSAQPVVGEHRGAWTTVILAGVDGFSAMCITDDSSHLFAKDMIGSVGTANGNLPLGPRDLTATDLGVGTMDAGDISLFAGSVGPDVVGVVYRSRSHGDVAATVSQGHFAGWFPGDELEDASGDGVAVEVTYHDGDTATRRLSL